MATVYRLFQIVMGIIFSGFIFYFLIVYAGQYSDFGDERVRHKTLDVFVENAENVYFTGNPIGYEEFSNDDYSSCHVRQGNIARIYCNIGDDKQESRQVLFPIFLNANDEVLITRGALDLGWTKLYYINAFPQTTVVLNPLDDSDGTWAMVQRIVESLPDTSGYNPKLYFRFCDHDQLLGTSYERNDFLTIVTSNRDALSRCIADMPENHILVTISAECTAGFAESGICLRPPIYEEAPPPQENRILDIVSVNDVSRSMRGNKIIDMKEANHVFTDVVFTVAGNTMGLVSYSDDVESFEPLTTNPQILQNEIDSYTISGHTCVSCGMNKAIELLQNSLNTRVILAMTDGEANYCIGGSDCGRTDARLQARSEAKRAWDDYGISTITVAFGSNAETDVLQDMAEFSASDGLGQFVIANEDNLADIYALLGQTLITGQNIGPPVDVDYAYVTGYQDAYVYKDPVDVVALVIGGQDINRFEVPEGGEAWGLKNKQMLDQLRTSAEVMSRRCAIIYQLDTVPEECRLKYLELQGSLDIITAFTSGDPNNMDAMRFLQSEIARSEIIWDEIIRKGCESVAAG